MESHGCFCLPDDRRLAGIWMLHKVKKDFMTNNMQQQVFEKIIQDASILGICSGDTVMIHSSAKALGLREDGSDGGLETVILGLLETVGPTGTLLFPGLSYANVTPDTPFFDARKTPTCVGAIAEYVRTRTGTIRSTHPTHSICAIGYRSQILTGSHHHDTTPVGRNSPLSILPQIGGKILMMGCGTSPNTSMHGVEELTEPPYLYSGIQTLYQCTDINGIQHRMKVLGHGFSTVSAQRYDRIEPLLAPDKEIWNGTILNAKCVLMDSAAIWKTGEMKLRQDPFYFVDLSKQSERNS